MKKDKNKKRTFGGGINQRIIKNDKLKKGTESSKGEEGNQ